MLEVKGYRIPNKYVIRELESENRFWLFDTENGDSFRLNRISYMTLNLLKESKSSYEICKSISNKFAQVSKDKIQEDIDELFTNLLEKGILQRKEVVE